VLELHDPCGAFEALEPGARGASMSARGPVRT
jgi:hypothetical protein